jgi:hypothetical protein
VGRDMRRLYSPLPVAVKVDGDNVPLTVAGVAVEAIREEWAVEDRWWTSRPLGRHYFELALADGCAAVVFRSTFSGRWYRQRA